MGKAINASLLVTEQWGKPLPVSYNTKDAILYAIGIGSSDLRFVYEKSKQFAVFPTYPIVLAFKGTDTDVLSFPSPAMMKAGTAMIPPKGPVLDAERELEILKPLPRTGNFFLKSRCIGVQDKGRGALVESESIIVDENGEEYVKMVSGTFFVGVTGFESAGQSYSVKVPPPSRAPDHITEQTTTATQTHTYRLSGDYNPLHIDPKIATGFGFKEPILHGLCSLGHAARHVLAAFGDNDPANFEKIRVRFSKPVLPGQTLVTKMWNQGNGKIVVVVEVKETGKVVISNAYVQLKCSAAASSPSPTSGGAKAGAFASDAMFAEIRTRIDAAAVQKVDAVFKFKVKKGGSIKTWLVDAKNGSGSVKQADGDADCTIIIGDDDLISLMTGKLSGMEAFMAGTMQIEGDMMLAQKLGDLAGQQARL